MSSLSKKTVRALLRVAQSTDDRFSASRILLDFIEDYAIGGRKGAALLFDDKDKVRIGEILGTEGIDPRTSPDAWNGITRAAALHLGPDEKFTATPVKRHRVAIKTLPGKPLHLNGQYLLLPPACHLDVDGSTVASLLDHETALLVENWESFNRIQDTNLDLSPAGENPLILWRGDDSDTRTDHALGLLRALEVSIWAFVDFDPAGLLIASGLPRLAGIIAPKTERLQQDLLKGLPERYQKQLPAAAAALDVSTSEPIKRLWAIIRRHGRALPQEWYLKVAVDKIGLDLQESR